MFNSIHHCFKSALSTLDVLIESLDEGDKITIRAQIKENLGKHKVPTEFFEKRSIGEILKTCAPDIITTVVCESLGVCIPFVGPILKSALPKLMMEISGKSQ